MPIFAGHGWSPCQSVWAPFPSFCHRRGVRVVCGGLEGSGLGWSGHRVPVPSAPLWGAPKKGGRHQKGPSRGWKRGTRAAIPSRLLHSTTPLDAPPPPRPRQQRAEAEWGVVGAATRGRPVPPGREGEGGTARVETGGWYGWMEGGTPKVSPLHSPPNQEPRLCLSGVSGGVGGVGGRRGAAGWNREINKGLGRRRHSMDGERGRGGGRAEGEKVALISTNRSPAPSPTTTAPAPRWRSLQNIPPPPLHSHWCIELGRSPAPLRPPPPRLRIDIHQAACAAEGTEGGRGARRGRQSPTPSPPLRSRSRRDVAKSRRTSRLPLPSAPSGSEHAAAHGEWRIPAPAALHTSIRRLTGVASKPDPRRPTSYPPPTLAHAAAHIPL